MSSSPSRTKTRPISHRLHGQQGWLASALSPLFSASSSSSSSSSFLPTFFSFYSAGGTSQPIIIQSQPSSGSLHSPPSPTMSRKRRSAWLRLFVLAVIFSSVLFVLWERRREDTTTEEPKAATDAKTARPPKQPPAAAGENETGKESQQTPLAAAAAAPDDARPSAAAAAAAAAADVNNAQDHNDHSNAGATDNNNNNDPPPPQPAAAKKPEPARGPEPEPDTNQAAAAADTKPEPKPNPETEPPAGADCQLFDRHFQPVPPGTSGLPAFRPPSDFTLWVEATTQPHADPADPAAPPPAVAPGASPAPEALRPPQRILFLHYNDRLTSPRYLCAVESALRWNPDFEVTVVAREARLFLADAAGWAENLGGPAPTLVDGGLDAYIASAADDAPIRPGLKVVELDWEPGMRGTPLEPWFANKTYEQSSWVMQNLGNAFRMGLLSKVGGVYLDMDIISVNPMAMLSGGKGDGMARALTKQDAEWFNNAFLAFPRGDAFLEELMKEFVSGFRGFIWARNGPRMVTRTYQARCRPQKGPPAPECKGLKITSTHVFHPATYNNRQVLFDDWSRSCEFMGNLAKRSIGIHWWHRRVQDKVELNPESVLARVIAKSCPAVVESFGLESLGISEKVAVGIPESLRNEDPDLLLKKQTGAAAKKA